MSFFSSKKIFNTSQQIKDALFRLQNLDSQQRQSVFSALVKELDDGGVSAEEIKRVARELREKNEISEIDKNELLQIISGN
ncbi:MAG TPA: hypothetical protein VJG65_04060 [Patescibacteria group bacterium]|nr:hypothetical protein [Patescibacteria group bacterium]